MRPTPVERTEHVAASAVTALRELPRKWRSSTNMTRSHGSGGEWRSKALGIVRPPGWRAKQEFIRHWVAWKPYPAKESPWLRPSPVRNGGARPSLVTGWIRRWL